MAGDNFQDNVKLDSLTRLVNEGPAVVIGTDPGAKSVILKNDLGEMHVVGNPTTNRTVVLPDSDGTLIFSGQAVQGLGVSTGGNTAGSTGTTIGTIVFAGMGGVTLSQSTAAGSLATITISANPGANVNAIGVSTGGNTAGTTGTTIGTVDRDGHTMIAQVGLLGKERPATPIADRTAIEQPLISKPFAAHPDRELAAFSRENTYG